MKRAVYLGFVLLAMFALVVSSFAQATLSPNALYRAWYDEKDPAKKTALGEQFITNPDAAFKASQYLVPLYQQTFASYQAAKNWAKVMELGEKLTTLIPNADDKLKAYTLGQLFIAANQSNNPAKTIEYGDKVLAADPNNLQALMIVPSAIIESLPAGEAQRVAALNKAADYAKKMLAVPKPAGASDADWAPVQGQAHFTVGLSHLGKKAYPEAITEFEQAVKLNKKDDQSQYQLGLAINSLLPDAQKQVLAAYEAENAAKAAKADQAAIDQLATKRTELETEFKNKRDLALDAFARATALAGPAAAAARPQFERLFKQRNPDATADEMNKYIAEKKAQLGA